MLPLVDVRHDVLATVECTKSLRGSSAQVRVTRLIGLFAWWAGLRPLDWHLSVWLSPMSEALKLHRSYEAKVAAEPKRRIARGINWISFELSFDRCSRKGLTH